MKTKLFLFLSVVLILASAMSCTNSLMPPKAENTGLMITIGASSDGARATYSPVFQDPPLSTFAKITLVVETTGGTTVGGGSTTGASAGSTWTIPLPDVPYGTYNITAKAYMDAEDLETDYAAIGTKSITFSASNARASLTLKPVLSGVGATGTLKYTLTDPDTSKVTAKLYQFDETTIMGTEKYTLTVDGAVHSIPDIPAGYYVLSFGDNVPSVVHIYKNMETELEETNNLFNLSKILPEGVNITLSREGKVRGGTLVTIAVSGQYVPESLKLNDGADTALLSPEQPPVGGVYTRTFTMPSKSVVVSALRIPVEIDVDFENLNKDEHLGFWSVVGGNPGALITSATLGQEITIKAYNVKTDPLSGEIAISSIFWYLNGEQQTSVSAPTFTIPSGSDASSVGAFITIGGAPQSVAIPINY